MIAQGTKVLVVDDDDGLRFRLSEFLAQHGVEVTGVPTSERALELLGATRFDALLLDVMLPGLSGLELLTRVRSRSDVPVLMLTAKDGEADRVRGLELGADDYLCKPFSSRELLARIKSVLRRSKGPKRSASVCAGDLELDPASRTARLGGAPLSLSSVEFELLLTLARSAGTVLPRARLLAEAGRNCAMVSGRTVDVHISRLRKKLGDDPKNPRRIKTVHRAGYLFTG